MNPSLPTLSRFPAFVAVLLIFFLDHGHGRSTAATLTVHPPDARGRITVESPGVSNQVHHLEFSTNLLHWRESAVLHDTTVRLVEPLSPDSGLRFYRLNSRNRTAEDDGKNAILLQRERFANFNINAFTEAAVSVRWIKFTILKDDPGRVWFQDSQKHRFHHGFASQRLPTFLGMSPDEFDRRTLYPSNSVAMLGAVLLGPKGFASEYGIQFSGRDPIPREEVARRFEQVRAAILAPPGSHALYIPTYEQLAAALQDRDWFASRGIEVSPVERWLRTNQIYNDGWTLGRLSYVPAAELAAAYADGRLRASDILLTDVVPSEVPPVAGIITLSPATPNSHVALLARDRGIPFLWVASPAERTQIRELAGREVAVRTFQDMLVPSLKLYRVLDIEGQMSPELREQALAPKQIRPLKYPPKATAGTLVTNVATLAPADARFVGGKAAHYGILRRTIHDNTLPAVAITFDLWDAFMDQSLDGGQTLRQRIESILAPHGSSPDIARLREDLAALRSLIIDTARFTDSQKTAVLTTLSQAGFEGPRKIRFRSSTNVEDGDEFTGAGLYDSFSGCILDDLDADDAGPCRCDPDERNERGVFRALQKVYASFYNENAVLERFRRGVRESEAGMAVLVHHSFPDSEELANGVATLNYVRFDAGQSIDATLVTQLGALSVANPDLGAQPEVYRARIQNGETTLTRSQASALVPLGGRVMAWDSDYRTLSGLLATVSEEYAHRYTDLTSFQLDFEYKRMKPGVLQVKQVRPMGGAQDQEATPRLVFNEPVEWWVYEWEFTGDASAHLLKSKLRFSHRPWWNDPAGLSGSSWTSAEFEFFDQTNRIRMTNGPMGWPNYSHRVENREIIHRWTWGEGTRIREFELRQDTASNRMWQNAQGWLSSLDFNTTLTMVTERSGTLMTNAVRLWPKPVILPDSLLQVRQATNASRTVRLATEFYWPEEPLSIGGYTAPNLGFVQTRLEGLTAEPVILRDPAAQTYVPSHHNLTERLIFEPARDPAVPAAQIAELEAQGIRRIQVYLAPPTPPTFTAYDAEENARPLK